MAAVWGVVNVRCGKKLWRIESRGGRDNNIVEIEIDGNNMVIDPLNERTEGVHTRVLELGSIENFGGIG